jgi:hypothetical protein
VPVDPSPRPPVRGEDPELDAVEDELTALDPTGDAVAEVIRDTFDQLYDGQHSGRWSFDQLFKTEKTHMGTLIEINLQRRFRFEGGDVTDYRVAGAQVDCKYSMREGGWTLPPEVVGHIALLVTADDARSSWRAGLIRVEETLMNPGRNRDAKGVLSLAGRLRIRWLWEAHGYLPPNLFFELDDQTREAIFSARSKRGASHGQARVNQLFRLVQGRLIRRAELATVAQQDDFMKRARGNGGARTHLQSEGILVLGHQDNDPLVARDLGLPVPTKGEFVSARVVPCNPADGQDAAEINGTYWRRAHEGDPLAPAPEVPRHPRASGR